ncbi:MAG: hypothetical protein K0Q95_2028 [Bacteroidota bacterium]|jgi:hypothetical protein|nr:hypothetical protein [Bacteroidota bacterium]
MTDTTIVLGGFTIHEPVTVFTDYIITVIAFIYYWKLPSTNEVVKYWRLFFLFISLSTFFGGSSHALFAAHEGWEYKSLWLPMQFLNGLAVYYAQKATLLSVLKDSKNYNVWKLSYVIQLTLYYIVLIVVQKYIVTIIDNALGLIPIMIVHLNAKVKEDYQKFIGYGILVSFITAIVHGLKFSLHDYFNYNDIAHVFIMISLTIMYWGVKQKATFSPEL